jgi:UDP-glucose 4-epimerase
MDTKILITGANGLLGNALACELATRKAGQIVGIDKGEGSRTLLPGEAAAAYDYERVDLCDYGAVKDFLKRRRIDYIYHFAALLDICNDGLGEPFGLFETNTRGTLNLLHAGSEAGVRGVIYASTMCVYGMPQYLPVDEDHPKNPVNLYGLTKLDGERYLRFYASRTGMRGVVLRFGGLFGPGKQQGMIYRLIRAALACESLEVAIRPNEPWTLTSLSDAVRANCAALEKIERFEFEDFNIGVDEIISVEKIADTVRKLTGSSAAVRIVNPENSVPFQYRPAKARQALGFVPRPLKTSLEDFLRWETAAQKTARP